LWRGVASLTLLRFAGDTAIRAPVPFVIFIAASYGARPESAGWLAVALGLSGLVSPLVSVIERRVGARRSILISTAIFAG
jgi:predicted MFS family arabinose efflux permease